ncbi:hypothetical protein IEO21_05431 [Rhodonia placenta]|uniref:Uncharacterized protein n=1 Tax=Rhodonia placenta TaxID=104341 RepID=A0A8H7U229_9APHY|nr:hypothetical protein IEO21_05431 [Postia placenta]
MAIIVCSCEATIVMFDVTLLMLYVMAIGFSVLRVYAISHRNKSIALATFIFGVITVPLNIYLYSAESYAYVSYLAGMPTCDQTPKFSNTLYFEAAVKFYACTKWLVYLTLCPFLLLNLD